MTASGDLKVFNDTAKVNHGYRCIPKKLMKRNWSKMLVLFPLSFIVLLVGIPNQDRKTWHALRSSSFSSYTMN